MEIWTSGKGPLSLADSFHKLSCHASHQGAISQNALAMQVLVQLKKFARAVTSIKKAVSKPGGKQQASSFSSQEGAASELSKALNTELSGIDTTVGGLSLLTRIRKQCSLHFPHLCETKCQALGTVMCLISHVGTNLHESIIRRSASGLRKEQKMYEAFLDYQMS